jgi:serine phosphatase RsbU (regulator of sigma subunit)
VRRISAIVQQAVLPTPPGRIGGLRIAARYEPAEEEGLIGGDLYVVQHTAFGTRALIGDVRGKGLDAVETVTVLLGAFRDAADHEPTLSRLAARLERTLHREGERRAGLDTLEGFTTAVLAEFPPGGDAIRLLNRGHPPPLLLTSDGSVRFAEPSRNALPLGLGALVAGPDPDSGSDPVDTFPFPPGSVLLLHTDGVTEARDTAGGFYDPVAGLAGRCFDGPGELLDALVDAVHRHTGRRGSDDMALLAVTRSRTVAAVPSVPSVV